MKAENMVSATHIAYLRNKRDLTQPQLAAVVSELVQRPTPYTTTIVSAWETGRRSPSLEAAQAMAQLFNCSVEYILGKTNSISETTEDLDANAMSETRISYDDLANYHGYPVYIVFDNMEHPDCWGIVDATANDKYTLQTNYGQIEVTKKSTFKLYPREVDYANAEALKTKNKLGMTQIMESSKPVYVKMKSNDGYIRGRYNGWYKVTEDRMFLQSDNGNVLPLSGINITFEVFSEV